MRTTARCSGCGAEIFWAVTANAKRIPIDAKPDPNGRIRIEDVGPGNYRAHVEKGETGALFGEQERYTSHFASCLNAAEFRQPRKPTMSARMQASASMTVRKKGDPRHGK